MTEQNYLLRRNIVLSQIVEIDSLEYRAIEQKICMNNIAAIAQRTSSTTMSYPMVRYKRFSNFINYLNKIIQQQLRLAI